MKKELKKLLAKVEAQGGRVVPAGSGHVKVYCPNRAACPTVSGMVTLSSTPDKDPRTFKNEVSQLRRCGFDL